VLYDWPVGARFLTSKPSDAHTRAARTTVTKSDTWRGVDGGIGGTVGQRTGSGHVGL